MKNKEVQITPAALGALLKDDIDNFMVASVPGGIEAQEAQGQKDFVANNTLPKECLHGTSREQLESIGIVFGDDVDDIFVEVKLPDGWKKVPTSHSMWSVLLDERERERADIFYKAAFYDRDAHIHLKHRFSCEVQPVGGWESLNYSKSKWHCVVLDCGKVVWTSFETLGPQPKFSDAEAIGSWYGAKDRLRFGGFMWLNKHYPDWKDPLAHWEED